jgi:hypothetical protein
MGNYLWPIALRRLLPIRSIRKAIYCGIAVGAVVGVTIALVKGYWPAILIGCGVGLVLGATLGLYKSGHHYETQPSMTGIGLFK